MRLAAAAVLISSALASALPPSPPAAQPRVTLGELSLRPRTQWGQAPAVRVKLDGVRFVGLAGHGFFLATRARAQGGAWTDWTRSEVWPVPDADFVWDRPLHHFVPYAALEALGAGPTYEFEAAVFDAGSGALLGRAAEVLQLRVQDAARPVTPPAPLAALVPQRACGLPGDEGCVVPRHGRYAMDAERWAALWAAVQATPNEQARAARCAQALEVDAVTARQLDALLSAFSDERLRLDLATRAAPRVVNPAGALASAERFQEPALRGAFLQLFEAQR